MKRLLACLMILILFTQSVLAQTPQNNSGQRLVEELFRSQRLGVSDLPARTIFLQETCESTVNVNGTVDDKLRFFCEVVVKSDACKDVPASDLRNCNRAQSPLAEGIDFIKGCATGVFNSVRDLMSFLWEAGQFIWDNLTDLRRAAQTVDRASQFANSIKLYIYTEYDRAYESASTPRGLNAARSVAQSMMGFLVRSLMNMLQESYHQFGCLNNQAKSEKVCKLVGDFLLPPAGFFAFLKNGARAARTFPSIGRALNGLRTGSRLRAYSARLSQAGRVLEKTLSGPQQEAIVRAHLVGAGELGANGSLAQVGNYTLAQLRRKAEILKEAGFSSAEIRKLMEGGIVGLGPDELRRFYPPTPPPRPATPAPAPTPTPRPGPPAGSSSGIQVRHPDASYEQVRSALRQGQVPADSYVSFVAPNGSRLPARIDQINPATGEVSLTLTDGSRHVVRGEELSQLRNSSTSREAFAAVTPQVNPGLQIGTHADPNYENVRSAFRQGNVPTDPYISFETPSGHRYPGKIESVNPATGEVTLVLPDGTRHLLQGESLATVRQSSTSRQAFVPERPPSAIRLEQHADPNYQSVRESLNRGQVPADPYISIETVDGRRIPARIESVNPATGEVGILLENGSRGSVSGHHLETIRQSSTSREVFGRGMSTPEPAPVTPPRPAPAVASSAHPTLARHGLQPQHAVSARGAQYKFSDFFTDGDGRVFVVADVTVNGQTFQRVYYRSNSSASFRNMPARNEGIRVPGYDKGPGEEFLALPSELQAFLSRRLDSAPPTSRLPAFDPKELEGIIPVNRSMDDYIGYYNSPGSLKQQVGQAENILVTSQPQLSTSVGHRMARPSEVRIADLANRPDFSRPRSSYRLKTDVYGEVDAFVYHSTNGQLEYTLLRDSSGRVWFADIGSATGGVNSYGVRTRGVTGNELLTPRWEYGQQIPNGYHGAVNPQNSSYQDAWKYIREIPEIQRWYQVQGLPIPD
jgi:hypothetical protein